MNVRLPKIVAIICTFSQDYELSSILKSRKRNNEVRGLLVKIVFLFGIVFVDVASIR